MRRFICTACGTQFPDAKAPPPVCPICTDPRQYVPLEGQRWTTLDELRAGHVNDVREDGAFTGIGTSPSFAIGQRALLVPYGDAHLLWDCVTLLDDATAAEVERRGGLAGIAISHPHYFSAMGEWAERFDCPIHLHAADRAWVMRPTDAISFWEGETLDLGHGLTLVRAGGHFPGGTVLHAGDALLAGDIIQVVPDRSHVGFLWSYPNLVPLPEASVRAIGDAVSGLAFDALYGAWWGRIVAPRADHVVRRSVERYGRALRGELADRRVFHVAARADWETAGDTYAPPGFADEGFIHLAGAGQVAGVLERYFAAARDLVLLTVEEHEAGDVRWEAAAGGERFPHLYGRLPRSAVIAVTAL